MIETQQEKARWLKDYPAAKQDSETGRIYLEEEGIESFQEYDRKHSIHYYCQDWLEVLRELLQEEDPEGILEDVQALCKDMG